MPKKYEATLRGAAGRVFRMFSSDSRENAAAWFASSYREATGRDPTEDEKKYFSDGHDVIAGGMTWELLRK